MDGLHHVVAAILVQRFRQRRVEDVLLLRCGHGRLHAEQGVDNLLMQLRRVLGVEQQVIDVGGPVVESGVQEAQLRRQGNVAGGAGVEFVQVVVIPQLQRGSLHRADGADEIAVDRVPSVRLKLVVLALVGNVVGIGGQQDEVVGLTHVQRVDQAAAEGLAGAGVFQLRLPHGL